LCLKFVEFFDKLGDDTSKSVKLLIEKIRLNIKWINTSYQEIKNWLENSHLVIESKLNYRLPRALLPLNYNLLFKTELNGPENQKFFPYYGEINILITCIETTSSLVLHIDDLGIDNSSLLIKSLTDSSFKELKAFNWFNDFKRQFFVANLTQELKSGQNYSLYMKFVGYLKDDNIGFYRSSYLDSNNNRKWLLTSDMEPTNARKSFPCFDEPAMKASFKTTVVHQKEYNALSNMPVDKIIEMYVLMN